MSVTIHAQPFSGLKRAIDLAAALFILLFLLPVLSPLICLLQILQSPGPLFFSQTRIGLHGASFRILKFRSLPIHPGCPAFPFGAWLRLHGWDELPQCLNILRGHMSLIGPRPLLPEEDAHTPPQIHLHRCSIRPGLTGLSQILGLRGVHPELHTLRVQTDLAYIQSWSLTLDLQILLRSLPILLPFTSLPKPKFAPAPSVNQPLLPLHQ